MSSGEGVDAASQRKRNYKLLVDPELDQSATKKVYRFNGVLVGYKPIPDPTDPRIQKTVLGSVKPCLDLLVPRFKYDKFSVTAPPRTDVLLLGISETAQGDLLKNLLVSEIGPTYFIKYHRHPKTNAFLGAASVSFKKNGHGRLAEELLDGRMLCGRHIKVQLDDKGDKAREFLRDVVEGGVKKTGNDIVVEGSIRRLSSTSSQKAEDVVNDPKESLDMTSDGSPNSSGHKLYPLSVLNINAGSVTPLYDTPSSVTNTCSVPPTPSSLDSGLSLTMPKQQDNVAIDKPKHLFSHSTLSCLPMAAINNKQTAISPPPMNTNSITALAAKINPPLPATDVKPPPLPSIPPNDIDNISISPISMEGEVPDGGGGSKGESLTVVDMVSPISTSPVDSLTEYDATLRAEVSKEPPTLFPTQFDPRLGLKGLLNMTSSVTTPAPPSVDLMPVSPPEYNDPAITVVSPPVASLEVEEISGDESPEMVYMYPSDRTSKGETAGPKESYKVKVEQLSSDDMEMASDEENTVIEVNPTSVAKQCSPPLPANHMMPYMECQMPPPRPPPMPHPPSHMFPPHPASMPLPLPFKPPPPPYFDPTAGAPPFHHRPPLPPHHHNHHHQQHMGPHPPFHPYDGGGPYRPPMYHPHLSKDSMKRPLGSLGGKELLEEMKKEVMMVVCQQLRDVLLRDMRKSLVETSAFASLDTFWERREKMKLERLQNRTNRINEPSSVPAKEAPPTISKDSQPSASKENDPSAAVIAAEAAAVNAEPYRQLLPDQAEEEVAPQQPRKRLLNFKIPLLNRGSHRRNQGVSLVTRRKVSRPHSPAGPPQQTVSRRKRKPSVDSYSDISSVSSSGESDAYVEEDEEGDISSPPRLARHTISKIDETESEEEESDDDSDIYEQLRNARKLSVNSVYSDRESSEEDMDEEEEPLQQKVVPSPPQPVPVHTDHIYAKPPKTPEAQNDNDDIVVEINEEEEKQRREELLTAQARQHSFPVRSAEREDEILHQFHDNYGPDKEDVEMLKQALKRLKEQKNELVDGVPWAYYPSVPPESIPLPSKRRKTTHHVTGSARTEGYYKIDPMEKKAYLRHSLPSFATPTPRNKASKKEESLSRSRSNRAAHRRLASVFSTGDASSDIHKFNQLKARKKQLKFSKSRIHGWGLFAMENIAADEMVIEYVGEVIRSSVADEREKRYEAAGIGSSYLFRMDMDYVIDATKKGSLARFINHCCDPNCYAKVINFGFQKKIVIYSKRDIKATEEITYDYKFPIEEEKIPCLCGAPNCRGTLN